MPRRERHNSSFKYDAALSFAGEDRSYAAKLFSLLTQRGLRVFYDADRQASLWGRSTETFDRIYGPESRFVIPVISRHYVKKDWTLYEFETAKREARKRADEFILPITLDDSRLLGLHDDVIKLDARRNSPAEIAKMFLQKCRPGRRAAIAIPHRSNKFSKILLNGELRRCLGLIASAALPLPAEAFPKLFPQHDWQSVVPKLRGARLLRKAPSRLEVTSPVLAAIRADAAEWKALNDAWVDRLSGLASHVDTAAFLALHLLMDRRYEEATRAAVDVAQHTQLGSWNDIYLILLRALQRRRPFHTLKRTTRLELLNSLGRCLLEAGEYRQAAKVYRRLRTLSVSYHSAWGIGQALLHAGLVAHKMGDDRSAARFYERAAAHAKRVRDRFLLGRSLGNLAQTYLDTDPDRAERMLVESVKAKRSARDSGGLVVAMAIRGSLAVARQDFTRASRLFAASARAARRAGMRYEQALSTYNHGRALEDSGQLPAAIAKYARARKLAATDGYVDVLVLCLNALGRATFAAQQFTQTEIAAKELLVISEQPLHRRHRVVALHTLACALRAKRNTGASARAFSAALAEARSEGNREWILRCLIDRARTPAATGLSEPNVVLLRRQARAEMSAGRREMAAGIWAAVAEVESLAGFDERASRAYQMADRCFGRSKSKAQKRVALLQAWFALVWAARRYNEAARVLTTLERVARSAGLVADALAAIDQRGQCYQYVGQYERAERLHRDAVRAARRAGQSEQLERSLNNLAEALRHLGRIEEALALYKESEKIAREAGRYDGALVAAHNRALALESLWKYDEAASLLTRTQREAARRELWDAYVNHMGTRANVERMRGKPRAALRLYRRALRAARKYGARQNEPVVALNLSRCMLAERMPRTALRLLKAQRNAFESRADRVVYFQTLADAYESCGHLRVAVSTWTAARQCAVTFGDDEDQRLCEAEEARVRTRLARAVTSDRKRLQAIRRERHPRRRAELMLDRLVALLEGKSSHERAQRALDEGLVHCTDHGLHKQKARFYLAIADHELHGSCRRKLTACKGYVMAFAAALPLGPKHAAEMSAHAFRRLGSLNSPVDARELKRLLHDLEASLERELADSSPEARRFILWPFLEAVRLAPLRGRPQRYFAALKGLGTRVTQRSATFDSPVTKH